MRLVISLAVVTRRRPARLDTCRKHNGFRHTTIRWRPLISRIAPSGRSTPPGGQYRYVGPFSGAFFARSRHAGGQCNWLSMNNVVVSFLRATQSGRPPLRADTRLTPVPLVTSRDAGRGDKYQHAAITRGFAA